MTLVNENIITDLRRNGIRLSKDMFDAMNEYINIQNSYAEPINVDRWQQIKDKSVLFTRDGEIVAVYGQGRFMYNPNKIKISQVPEYDIFEITEGGVNVQKRRQERRDALSGLVKPSETGYSNVPTSTIYVWDKDWNPEVNKRYYTKLLQRNHLVKYATQLNDAYDVVKELIDQRKERLTGKRTEYDRLITDISRQIGKIEDEMIAAERDFEFNPDKLKKEISKLPGLVNKAKEFIKTENDEYKVWGKRKKIPYDVIEK